jgi:rod shape-determining protein MreC
MRQAPRRSWFPLALLFLALVLLVFHESGVLGPLETGLHLVFDPLQRALSGLVSGAGDLFVTVREVRELRQQVEELTSQVNSLTIENVRLLEFQAEAEQLRALLNFTSDRPTWTFVGASVVGREACDTYPCGQVVGGEPNPYLRYVTIDVGSLQGVEVGMPVVSAGAALVGRVSQVFPRTARVQLLPDVGSAVDALLQTSRLTGLVVGDADSASGVGLRMEWIPQDDELEAGEIVLTSGLGGLLPKGLVIGQTTEIRATDYELFQTALVRPAVDFRRLETVLVITSFEPIPLEEEVEAPEAEPGEP